MIKQLSLGAALLVLGAGVALAQTSSSTITTTQSPDGSYSKTITREGVNRQGEEVKRSKTYKEGASGSSVNRTETVTDPATGEKVTRSVTRPPQ